MSAALRKLVALVLMVGAALAFVLARCQLPGTLGRVVLFLGWSIGTLLLMRGLGAEALLVVGPSGVTQNAGETQAQWSLTLWNPWFTAGGLAFTLASVQHQLARP